MFCPVCENKTSLASMEMTPELVEEMTESEPVADFCGEKLLEYRLKLCSECTRLISGMTCAECGCFVQFRARHSTAHCVLNRW
ncbi:MAG: hypothetical protein J5527_08215 [Treponema sp.]|nr:hypothetical protein [Treponema sp.]